MSQPARHLKVLISLLGLVLFPERLLLASCMVERLPSHSCFAAAVVLFRSGRGHCALAADSSATSFCTIH